MDIRVRHKRLDALIEVKSNADPIRAIREAIGQLLEYGLHRPGDAGPATVLVIAAPGAPTAESAAYMDKLQSVIASPIRYVHATDDAHDTPL